MRKLIPAAVALAALVAAPLALAASSPTVAASAVTKITDTAATLHGTIDPNGLATTYQFEYGPTDALGTASPATAASAGAGTAAVAKATRISGLAPDTTYYYELVATNKDGTSTTPIESFKTTGNPAPVSTTDAAASVGRNVATLVGTIAPNNQATTYYFQYGLTSSYGFQTAVASIPAGTAPATVTAVLPGLAPNTVFHYRLVSSHGATATTVGADMTFETLPWPRRRTGLAITVTPHTTKRSTARFTVRGNITLPSTTPAALGCHGTVTVRYYLGRHQLATARAFVGPQCGFKASHKIHVVSPKSSARDSSKRKGQGKSKQPLKPVAITIRASFGGNIYQAPISRSAKVTLG